MDRGVRGAAAPEPSPEPSRESSRALGRGLDLLDALAGAPSGLTVTELAAALGTGRPVVYRLLATLDARGWVRRGADGRVRLGAAALHLAQRVQPVLRAAALPVLRALAEDVGATAHLTLADGDEALAVAVVEPSWTDLHVAYRVGTRHALDRGAAGRVLLAARRGEVRGGPRWLATDGELQPGAHGVAAAVVGVAGLEASVGVVALAPLDVERTGPRVELAAAALTRALTHPP